MITLERLRDFARSLPPDDRTDLDDGDACLAAKATGVSMRGHHYFENGEPVPEAFATYSYGLAPHAVFTNREIADDLDRLVAGADPTTVAFERRNSVYAQAVPVVLGGEG